MNLIRSLFRTLAITALLTAGTLRASTIIGIQFLPPVTAVSNPTELANAITAANATPTTANTISLAAGTYTLTADLPDLAANTVTSRLMTPIDFQDRLSSYRGAAFGLEPILTQSAWVRPHNRSEEVGRLFLVGAGTHPGAGLPGVLSSARVLDSLVPDAQSLTRTTPVTA